jgi:hypothetical protein
LLIHLQTFSLCTITVLILRGWASRPIAWLLCSVIDDLIHLVVFLRSGWSRLAIFFTCTFEYLRSHFRRTILHFLISLVINPAFMRIWRILIFRFSFFFYHIAFRELNMQIICRFGKLMMKSLLETGFFLNPYLLLRIAKQVLWSILYPHSLGVWIPPLGRFCDLYLLVWWCLKSQLWLLINNLGFFLLLLMIELLLILWRWTEVNRVTFGWYDLSATFLVILQRQLNELPVDFLVTLNVSLNLCLTCDCLADLRWVLDGFRGQRGRQQLLVLLQHLMGRI